MATEFTKALEGKMVLGVLTATGIPARPAGTGPRLPDSVERQRGVRAGHGSDATAMKWVPFGKFTQPLVQENGKLDR